MNPITDINQPNELRAILAQLHRNASWSGTFAAAKGYVPEEYSDEQRHQQACPRSQNDTGTSPTLDAMGCHSRDYCSRSSRLGFLAPHQHDKSQRPSPDDNDTADHHNAARENARSAVKWRRREDAQRNDASGCENVAWSVNVRCILMHDRRAADGFGFSRDGVTGIQPGGAA